MYLSYNYLYKWREKLLVFKKDCGYCMSVTSPILWEHQGQKHGLFCFIFKLRTYCVLIVCQMDGWMDGWTNGEKRAATELTTKDMDLSLSLSSGK